jgi:hypothetical protein
MSFVPGTKIKKPKCELVGQDGNAYFIIGRVSRALRRAGCGQDIIDEYTRKSTSGDYANVLRTAMEYIEDVGHERFDEDD